MPLTTIPLYGSALGECHQEGPDCLPAPAFLGYLWAAKDST
jgi:hypothetical protein